MWAVTPGRLLRRPLSAAAVLVIAALAATAGAAGGDDKGERRAKLRLNALASFDKPVFVSAPEGAGDVAFVVEREGKIRLLDGERKRGTFLNMKRWVGCCR